MKYIKNHLKLVISIILTIIVIILVICLYLCNYKLEDNINDEIVMNNDITNITSSEVIESSNEEDAIEFYVDIKGEVKNPGVYKVSDGSIVNDAIKLAGGLTKNAYTDNINLSQKLTSEMVIYIYNKNKLITTTNVINDVKCTTNIIEVTTPTTTCPTTTSTTSTTTSSISLNTTTTITGLININTASKSELMTLNGIGETKADAIIIYRMEHKFESIEDIKNVSGIGDAAFEKIKNDITV